MALRAGGDQAAARSLRGLPRIRRSRLFVQFQFLHSIVAWLLTLGYKRDRCTIAIGPKRYLEQNTLKKIVTVLGARPQFIKASVVSHAMRASGALAEVLVHTGQHFDANMSDVFFEELGMSVPTYILGVHGGGHGEMTGRMLIEIERVLVLEKPDAVLVYGDTNSTLAGALAAVKLHIPVAHVEAGLRSFNMAMPEEVNRILTDRVSRWLFTPTAAAERHLAREGVAADQSCRSATSCMTSRCTTARASAPRRGCWATSV